MPKFSTINIYERKIILSWIELTTIYSFFTLWELATIYSFFTLWVYLLKQSHQMLKFAMVVSL